MARNTLTPGIGVVCQDRLFEFADDVATYEKYSSSSGDWYLVDAPYGLMKVLLNRGEALRFPVLRSINNTPIINGE
jgi:hypothetical protein